MNELRNLYQKNNDQLVKVREAFIDEDLEGPLLMELAEFFNQSVKFFIIGQETNGWCCEYKNHNALLDTYTGFNMGAQYRRSPFWDITRKIENIIKIPNYSCAWSNINRYDHNCGEPKGKILKVIESLDYLVRDEISILKPDICMFFTNRKYDYRIENLFPDIKMESIDGLPFNHFVRLHHELLPPYSFRTPHPKTIRIQKWEEAFRDVMEKVLPKAK